MSFFGGGRNPLHGHDRGPPPPANRQSYGLAASYGYGYPQPYGYYPTAAYYPQQPFYQGPYGHPYAIPDQGAYVPGIPRPTRFAMTNQVPAPNPVANPAMPAANMSNSTGGVGCEPGYNYFFPSEHTKIHVLRTDGTPPWQMDTPVTTPFHAAHVPVHTTIGELLKGFGAVNPDSSKNKVTEVHEGGHGKWYRGMSFSGDNDKEMAKEIKDVGWDSSRNGLAGGKPVVYLYVTKG